MDLSHYNKIINKFSYIGLSHIDCKMHKILDVLLTSQFPFQISFTPYLLPLYKSKLKIPQHLPHLHFSALYIGNKANRFLRNYNDSGT